MQPFEEWQSATTSAYYRGDEHGGQPSINEGLSGGVYDYGSNDLSPLVTNIDSSGISHGVGIDTSWLGSNTGMTGSNLHVAQHGTGVSNPANLPGNGSVQPQSMPRLGQAGPSDYAQYHHLHGQSQLTTPGVPPLPTVKANQPLQTFSTPEESQYPPRPPPQSLPTPLISLQATPTTFNADITIRNYPNGTVGPSLKRGMACGFCRRRKLRCTAERPVCANCVKYKRTCEYTIQSNQAEEEGRAGESGPYDPLVTPGSNAVNGSSGFTDPYHTFPPRLGWETIMQRPSTVDASQAASDRLLLPQGFPHPFPPGPAAQNSIGSASTPTGSSCQPNTPAQFAQYGTLSFPPFKANDSPSFMPMPPHSLAPAPQTLSAHPTDTYDVKPYVPSPEGSSQSGYPTRQPEFRVPNQPPTSSGPRAPNRQASLASSGSMRSLRGTPDVNEAPPPNMMVDPSEPYMYDIPPPKHSALFTAFDQIPRAAIDPIDGLTERLGEFLFAPVTPPASGVESSGKKESAPKRRKQSVGGERREIPGMSLVQPRAETDGLTDAAREHLLGIFLAHSRLFFEISVPRFRYRMTFNDRRRPSLSLLNAMYLWASRISSTPNKSPMEELFFNAGCRTLEAQTSRADRLLDGMRAAMLLGTYAYINGRYHEGWLLAGMAVRLVISTGIHQIPSCTFSAPPVHHPLLRRKTFLLPPPEDKLELAERIHTFWAVFSIERSGSLATGFPSAIRDQDITTPFPLPLSDIASGNVTSRDDVTVRDLYRFSMLEVEDDTKLVKWIKSLIILERAAKLAFLDPTDDGDYSRAWTSFSLSHPSAPAPAPAPWLDQPKYRCPGEYGIVKLALDQFVQSMGVEGIFPVDRRRNAQIDRAAEPFLSSHTVVMHHILAAVYMFLHDINSIECENIEALAGARKSVALFKYLPQIPVSDVDSFVVVIWGMMARTLVKEMHRLRILGDIPGASSVESEADLILSEMKRVGVNMSISRTQALGVEALKNMDSRTFGPNMANPVSTFS